MNHAVSAVREGLDEPATFWERLLCGVQLARVGTSWSRRSASASRSYWACRVEPEARRRSEMARESQGSVCSDGPLAVDDLVDPARWDADVLGQSWASRYWVSPMGSRNSWSPWGLPNTG